MSLHGRPVAGFEAFDQLLRSFCEQHAVPGASMAIGRGGKILYARSIGFANVDEQMPVEPHSLFRIASISKPITAVAILQQVERGTLTLDTRVWELLKLDEPTDLRWKSVTVRQLLQHTGGWDRSVSFDPMFQSVEFAAEAGTPPPARPAEIIRAMLQRPLDCDPGTKYAYSNFGYCLLGRVLECLSTALGRSYEQIVRDEVFAPVGALSPRIGRTLTTSLDEVRYSMPVIEGESPVLEDSVFAPGEKVSPPYGAWHLEAMDAHGGWIASAPDLVRFAMGCDETAAEPSSMRKSLLTRSLIEEMFSKPTDYTAKEPDVWYGHGWNVRTTGSGTGRNTWHLGALDGTSTILVRRSDGMTWAVLFNMRMNSKGEELARLIDPLVHGAANAVPTLL
jgi:CubicO group peptidase (beta-lactamase class C family)